MTGRPVAVVVTPGGRHAVIVPPPSFRSVHVGRPPNPKALGPTLYGYPIVPDSGPPPADPWALALFREREAAQNWRLMFPPKDFPPG